MTVLTRAIKAFLVGAFVGLTGQSLIWVCALFVPPAMAVPAATLLFGVLGIALIGTGFYAGAMEFGGNGAAIPIWGLMFAAAAGRAEAQSKGVAAPKAFWIGFIPIIKIIGAGFVLAFLLGMVLEETGATTVEAPGLIMQFVWAVIIGGAISATAQLLSETKAPFPIIAVIMIAFGGGLLTYFGFMKTFGRLGVGGASMTAVACGSSAYEAGTVILSGVAAPLIIGVALNIILVAMGAFAGVFMLDRD